MTDLLTTLYEHIAVHHMGIVWNDPEYESSARCIETHTAALHSQLSDTNRKHLDILLDELTHQHSVELEAMFQSTLALCRELNGVLLP